MVNTDIKNSFNALESLTPKLVAIIDDEPDILELISITVRKAGYKAKEFTGAKPFLEFLKTKIPDLLLLDLMLEDTDGFEICKFLKNNKKYSQIPIIMLTARVEETDKVLGLELGADDYITKPFSQRELNARIKAVLRRSEKVEKQDKIRLGDILEIDLNEYEVYVSGKRVELTPTEYKILMLLTEHRGWVYSRDQILDFLGGQEKGVFDRTVDVHIKNLRDKLGEAGDLIKNKRGIGYKIEG
jgi:two-component system phosphate regulon response regulator PhoB/two-component system alkaline phosphatase synthesis response regulator PhoP